MANWMIRLGEGYLGIMYDYLHSLLYKYHVIQADETPVLVNKDGRPAGSQSWMWVYRSGFMQQECQIILYEYQKTRNASHPRKFLKDYTGICVTDGYQVYHTLEKEREDLKIAGCWAHCRRRFNDALEIVPKVHRKESVLYLIMNQIRAIYREEGKLSDLFIRRPAYTASISGQTTCRCFLCVPETDQFQNPTERESERCFHLCAKSGAVFKSLFGRRRCPDR